MDGQQQKKNQSGKERTTNMLYTHTTGDIWSEAQLVRLIKTKDKISEIREERLKYVGSIKTVHKLKELRSLCDYSFPGIPPLVTLCNRLLVAYFHDRLPEANYLLDLLDEKLRKPLAPEWLMELSSDLAKR